METETTKTNQPPFPTLDDEDIRALEGLRARLMPLAYSIVTARDDLAMSVEPPGL